MCFQEQSATASGDARTKFRKCIWMICESGLRQGHEQMLRNRNRPREIGTYSIRRHCVFVSLIRRMLIISTHLSLFNWLSVRPGSYGQVLISSLLQVVLLKVSGSVPGERHHLSQGREHLLLSIYCVATFTAPNQYPAAWLLQQLVSVQIKSLPSR